MVDLSVWEQAARAARDADILSVAVGALAVGVALIAAGLIRRGRTAVACAALVAAAVLALGAHGLALGAHGLAGERAPRALSDEVGHVWGVSRVSCDTGVSYGLPDDGSYPCSWTKDGKTVKGTLRTKGSKAGLYVGGKALKPVRDA